MNNIIKIIMKFLLGNFMTLKWHTIVISISLWAFASWLFLDLSGEHHITRSWSYLYWLIVTGSSTGYGDFYPLTIAGQYVTGLFVIPIGFSMFAMCFGKIGLSAVNVIQKQLRGQSKLNKENHILLIGWRGQRTMHLLTLLAREEDTSSAPRDIVLCVMADISNPLPGVIAFTKVLSFTDDNEMDRACISKAACIIVDNPKDEETLSTALYCQQRNPDAHMISYFKDERKGQILTTHCPNVECMPSVAIEMMAKSAADPGSSRLHHELLNVANGETQYSIQYPSSEEPIDFEHIFMNFKRNFKATVIGISAADEKNITINPDLDSEVQPESTVYYIADERINNISWV